ncbi:Aromatic amino acid exporter YddG [Dirofilaria immitis]
MHIAPSVDSRWYVWLRSIEGARPVRVKKVTICYTLESGCLRLQPKEGGKPHLRLNMTTRPIANKAEVERICWDPKDGELYLSRMKPEETLVEVRSDSDVQIDRLTLILKQQIKKKTWPQRVRGSQWLALKTLGVGPVGASIGADLGGSSKYSKFSFLVKERTPWNRFSGDRDVVSVKRHGSCGVSCALFDP